MKCALLLVLLALVALANAGAEFTATVSDGLTFAADVNVTVDAGDDRYHYRRTTLTSVGILGQNIAVYESIAADAQHSGSTTSGELDIVFGYGGTFLNTYPGFVLAYLSASGSANSDQLSATFTASGSAIATVYYSIEEVTSSGAHVKTTLLKDLTYSLDDSVSSDAEIKYARFSATSSGATISLTMVVSAVAGILNVGGAPITPKSAEIVVEIDNYNYASASNHLILTVYTATASADATVQATANTMISGSGNTQVYIHFNGEAVVDGTVQSVTVSGAAEANSASTNDLHQFEAYITANGELHVDVRKVTVAFPANAAQISYDPAMGFQAPKDYSAAGTLSVPAALIFAISALLAFFL